MVGNNGIGGKGVAYNAKLMGHNIMNKPKNFDANVAKAYGGKSTDNSAKAHVFNASYGKYKCYFDSSQDENSAYDNVKTLRGGKGGLIVKSAGNGFQDPNYPPDNYGPTQSGCEVSLVPSVSNGNAAFDQANVVDNVIVVAAVNANGKKSSYSTTGANIWVSGIGGEYGLNAATYGIDLTPYSAEVIANYPGLQPAMITTDQSGCTKGYHTNKSVTNKSLNEFEKEGSTTQTSKNINCNYTSIFNGTSSAAPTVSGVIALMLEANPNLTWRDVKHILAMTAKKVDANFSPIVTSSTADPMVKTGQTVEKGWVENDANIKFHNWYGFGLVDAGEAVAMAKGFTLLTAEKSSQFAFTKDLPLNTAVDLSINTTFSNLETARIDLDLTASPYVGSQEIPANSCLQVELTSARGTTSILLNGGSGFLGFIKGSEKMSFTTNAFYGEAPNGTWKTTVRNICTTGAFTIQNAKISITARGR